MSSGDLLPSIIGILLVAGAAAFVLLPFARGARAGTVLLAADDDPRRERFALYQQVLELEFDRQVGKLSAEDFQQLSAELLAEAGQALRDERGTVGEIDAEIEEEIAAARAAFAAARQTAKPARRRKAAGTRT